MDEEIKSELMFYFVWDDMIVLQSSNWVEVLCEATNYYERYGKDHTYDLYSINKYDYKQFRNSKECQ